MLMRVKKWGDESESSNFIINATNLYAVHKWIFWSRGFLGAFFLYQKKYGVDEKELERLMRKAIDCGVEQTINSFKVKNYKY